ncbi:MAG TPA: CHAT domain-containing protein, partial [Kofleriaceae bacterium]|nr:CHAT domain-containing protein [Kofleriaceae bacterium]
MAAALQVVLWTRSARADDPFGRCEQELASHPETYEASLCFYKAAAGSQRWGLGREHLRRLRRAHPDVHWPTLCLGYIEYNQGGSGTEDLFQAAAEGFAAQGVAKGEVLARLNLGTYLVNGPGKVAEAAEQIRRATAVAEASGDRELQARALVGTAQLMEHSGTDLESAYRVLRQVESLRDVPPGVRNPALHLLGNMAHQLGRYDEAIQHYRELARLLGDASPSQELAAALYSIANSMLDKRLELPTPGAREEILAAAERALHAGIESGNALYEAVSRALVARLLASDPGQRDVARQHLDRCLELARRSLQPQRQSECLWYLSELEADRDPVAAAGYVARAIEIADQGADRWFVPFAWRYRTELEFRAGPRDQAVADGLRLLDVIETFRELQVGEGGRAGVLSRWAGDYYRVSGELLRGGGGGPSRHELELGFQVAERLRARVLLDRIATVRAGTAPPADPSAARERQETLEAISQVHRQLLRPEVKSGERDEALRRLEVLESREADLRDQLARSSHSHAAPSPRTFARLEDVQRLLAGDEALLSFQVGLWRDMFGAFEGGAWLLVVTRDDVRAHRIPDRVELEAMVPTFTGLFAARDGREGAPAAALYQRLLSAALEELPAQVTRLVIIPDGRLHQLPFPALRVPPSSQPLGLRYALSVVPSATIWASWRRGATKRAPKTVWAFADPVVGPDSRARTSAAAERSWLSGSGAPLGPLPHARQEGERLVRTLGGEHVLLIGADASEHALKAGHPGSFAILHLAAHAVIDDEHPERSAVLLAPGDDSEDGLLQPREISELDLEGRIVVLSGCRTASGKVIQGEGVLSLARAFFEAGATAVIGSLWPLRDDEAEMFFGQLYTRLGQGERLDRAVQLAQKYAVDHGAPSAAWAGIVLLGDG